MNTVLKEKEPIQEYFDSIAPRYDRVNQLLSWNLDDLWRKRARDMMLDGTEKSILDLGTGTGKFLKMFLEKKSWDRVAGVDFSQNMLEVAKRDLPQSVELVNADFHNLPFHDGSFDLVVSSYALRSVQEFPAFLKEIHRVLSSRGKAGLLCLTRPVNPIWRALAFPYLKFILPMAGGAITGNKDAYHFLSKSILTFQEPVKTVQMLQDHGFRKASIHPFTLGLATLILASK